MSLGLGLQNEEVVQLQKRLAAKDAECATIKGELLKKTNDFNEFKVTQDETLHKLRMEADRAIELEGELSKYSEDLKRKQLNLMNAESTIRVNEEKMKEQMLATRDLQAVIDSISYKVDGSDAKYERLMKEKSVMEARIKELESENKKPIFHPPVFQPPPSLQSRNRPRSSSVSNARVDTLEQELNRLRPAAAELTTAQEKLSRLRDDLLKVQNENIALERRLQSRVDELEAALEEKDEDMVNLRAQCQEGEARMEELQRRRTDGDDVEDVRQMLKSVEKKLAQEKLRVEDAEYRLEKASQEAERAKREASELTESLSILQATSQRVSSMTESQSMPTLPVNPSSLDHPPSARLLDDAVTAQLLNTIDRLRGERDSLRRDLDFVQIESRFSIEASTQKLESIEAERLRLGSELEALRVRLEDAGSRSTEGDGRALRLENEVTTLRAELDDAYLELGRTRTDAEFLSTTKAELTSTRERLTGLTEEVKRLALVSTACAITTSHSAAIIEGERLEVTVVQAHVTRLARDNAALSTKLASMETTLQDSERRLATTEACLQQSESNCSHMQDRINRLQAEVDLHTDDTLRLTSNFDTTKFALDQANERVADLEKAMENTEADRANLALQIEHLEEELATARREVGEMETKSRAQAMALSNGGTNGLSKVLREQVEALEERVERRTEQIGIHQHDIKRLETNLNLQEERISELMAEAETVAMEKQAMLEDCASARDARDEAQAQVENLEVDVDALNTKIDDLCVVAGRLEEELAHERNTVAALETQREQEIVAVVGAFIKTIGDGRAQVSQFREKIKYANEQVALLVERLEDAEEEKKSLLFESSQRDEKWTTMLNTRTSDTEEAVTSLASVKARLEVAEAGLVTLQQTKDTLEASLKDAEAEVMEKGRRLEEHMHQRAEQASTIADGQRRMQETGDQINRLEGTLRAVTQELEDVKSQLDQQNHAMNTDRAVAIAERENKMNELITAHREEVGTLRSQVTQMSSELESLRNRLESDTTIHNQAKERYQQEASQATAQCKRVQQAVSQLESELAVVRSQLQESQHAVQCQEEEKGHFQETITNLEAEIQKSLSLQRYLESQLKDSESAIATVKEELTKLRDERAESERSGKAAEIELHLRTAKFESEIKNLQRKLASYSGPTLEQTVSELQHSNSDMEALLKAKCAEIEENDDRIIEMLKEKKKLSSKVDSLTRKVQNLQNKLAVATAQREQQAPAVEPSSSKESPPDETTFPRKASSHHPDPPASTTTSRPIIEPRRAFSVYSQVKMETPTPPHPFVFRAKTPEPGPSNSTREDVAISAGKKRSAPDDFDPIEPLPAQAIMAESLTPRHRKPSNPNRPGFTPVRGGAGRPAMAKPSPLRRMASTLVPNVLSDREPTSSPKASVGASKSSRGWLGKIRGGGPAGRPVFESIQNARR